MSEQATIDALRFAQEQRRLSGSIPLVEFPRLSDVLLERAGNADYELAGSVDRNARPVIDIEVRAAMILSCQRCLGRFDYALKRTSRLVIVPDGEPLPDVAEEEPDVEAISASAASNVADIVEQEILLGLPLFPAHEDASCADLSAGQGERPESPFAVLAQLKKS